MALEKQYTIEFTPAAVRDFKRLTRSNQQRLQPKIDALAENPRPAGVVALRGGEGILRLRVGNYRILYQVEEDRVVVLVIRIGHRREVYRKKK